MLKKITFIIVLITSIANATWDHFPILEEKSGQVSAMMLYQRASGMTARDYALKSRYSVFDWLELSAGLDYRVLQKIDGDLYNDDYGLMEVYIGSRIQFAEHWNIFLEYTSLGYHYYEYLAQFGFQYSRGVFGSEYGIYFYGYSAFEANIELELKFFRESLVSPYIGLGLNLGSDGSGEIFVLGATLNLTKTITIDYQLMFCFGDRYINDGYKVFVLALTFGF